MANSIKELKKEINYIYGEVIDEASYKQLVKPEIEDDKIDAIIDEAVSAYEDFTDKINVGKKSKDKKTYFKELEKEYTKNIDALVQKINAL